MTIMTLSVSVAATVAAATAAGYQTMAPKGQWYGATFTGSSRHPKQLALTYDDGPNDPDTLRLLDVLAKHEVRATFFLLGRHVHQRPDIARAVAQAGHVIGNHTYSHPLLIFQPAARVQEQIQQCQQAIVDATAVTPTLFRPPFGGRRPAVLKIARQLGLQPVMWSVTGFDWEAQSADAVERKVSRNIRGGDVILLHDGGHLGLGADRSKTVTATERLIVKYKALGYEFVTVPQMMAAQGRTA